jgi:hypothetical protein
MTVPLALPDFLCRIAAETARMSYPGSMSRGKRPVVFKGAKARLESYFTTSFPITLLWSNGDQVARDYDAWHERQSHAIAAWITESVPAYHSPVAVSTKFLNTFMHQLMKYGACRGVWRQLHLPLDRRVFGALGRLRPASLSTVHRYFSGSPYSLCYAEYCGIQTALWSYLEELNRRPGASMQLGSRIELNWLWI